MEQCDAVDHDCNGAMDDPQGSNLLESGQACGSSIGGCAAGTVVGCDLSEETPGALNPHYVCSSDFVPSRAEVCNGIDDDCDGVLPDDEQDPDGDGMLACTGCEGLTLGPQIIGCSDCAPEDDTILLLERILP